MTAITQMCLAELAKRTVTIPARWGTAEVYETLVREGLAAHVLNVDRGLCGFKITETGRKIFAAQNK